MKPLRGRLGLESARIPQSDRHGVMWLGRGNLVTEQGTLHFLTAGDGDLEAGDYSIPFQTVSCLVMQPGTTVTHDAVRLLAAHGTGLVFVGSGAVRFYASMPFGRRLRAGPPAGRELGRPGPAPTSRSTNVRVANGRNLP